jgi:DNA polymerase elongation subunit (family B)
MSQFYTNVQQYGNKLLVREIQNGKKKSHKVNFKPTLFIKTQEETKYKSVHGVPLAPMVFGDINDAKEFIQTTEGTSNFELFGNTSYAYQYITETYSGEIEHDFTQMTILTLDIETTSENGFPSVENVEEEVLLITVQDYHTKKITTFGTRKFDVSQIKYITNTANYEYVKCKNEEDLLATFLKFWVQASPEAVTGWFVQLFDIPYLVRRMCRILPEGEERKLSPWKIVNERNLTINGREHTTYDLVGIATLDYIDLYKKFTYTTQENYTLDNIAFVELERKKLDLGYETHKDWYENDWQTYVEYNVVDVELVDGLEGKLRLIELILNMAYDARCNYIDVFSPVKMWDCILYNHLWNKNIIVEQRKSAQERTIEGAYVKEPVPGRYDWVVSFDAASLYPSILMQYNMSPEMIQEGKDPWMNVTVNELLTFKTTTLQEQLKSFPEKTMTANGYVFSRDKQGLFPEVVERIFTERVYYKKKMIEAEREYERTHDESLKNEIARLDNIQMSKKIALNSLYGAMANVWFRYYDDRIAEGITMTGQFIIQKVAVAINVYLNKVCETTGVDYAFYGDTDSCYIHMGPLVEKFFQGKSDEKITDTLDKICDEKLTPIINEACHSLALTTNAFQEKIFFKRESIAKRGVWIAKKRYAMTVYDSEGVRYEEPKLKVKGLEVVRSSTPAKVRQYLRDALKIVLGGTEAELQAFVVDVERDFRNMSPDQVAFPRSANMLKKYSSDNIYAKGCPMQIRAALLYNHHIEEKKLTKKYQLIREGDKVKFVYLTMPNPIHENAIAFFGKIPPELNLSKYVDYDTMFEKGFVDPLKSILQCMGWSTEVVATLDSIF